MNKNAALLPILLLVVARGLVFLSSIFLFIYNGMLFNFIDAKLGYLLFWTIPSYLVAVVSGFALGLSINGLATKRFQDKSVGVAITALTTIAFIQAFMNATRVGVF